MITNDVNKLKEQDIYSILLYAIYKCTEDPQYATISELIYTLDKDSLLKLCSIFGGCTIKIPTLAELKVYTNALLVYQLMSEGKSFNEAFAETELDFSYKKEIAKVYTVLRDIINDFGKK